jgi:hypothetical protein
MTITTLKLDGRLGSEAAAKLEAGSTERAGARASFCSVARSACLQSCAGWGMLGVQCMSRSLWHL